MITTTADFLKDLRNKQAKIASSQGISHRPTIGKMYEGITKNLLDAALFDGLNIQIICNSFIKIENIRSHEFDLLIIEGDGEPIPFTNGQFEVSYDQVIAVIQVKKTLNIQQLEEGYLNLKNVFDIAPDGMCQYHVDMFNDIYPAIVGANTVVNGKVRTKFTSSTDEALYLMLKWEAILPARILFSYEGYKTEQGLRDAFFKFLKKKRSTSDKIIEGFGPLHFPNLIVNKDYAIIKNNALPYIGKLEGTDWPFYASNSGNPFLALLEIIWTRLTYKCGISSSVFGEDLTLAGANLFISGNIVWVDGMRGWNFDYKVLSEKTLTGFATKSDKEWEPTKLSEAEHHIIAYLCKHGSLRVTRIKHCLDSAGFKSESELLPEDLINTGLVYIVGNKDLKLKTKFCQTVITKDGIFGADNKTGRLTRWVDKRYPALKTLFATNK